VNCAMEQTWFAHQERRSWAFVAYARSTPAGAPRSPSPFDLPEANSETNVAVELQRLPHQKSDRKHVELGLSRPLACT
jgi:hypothetical protein